MPSIRTEVTEITTGLAMLGYQDLDRALEVRPRHITHVDDAVFDRLESARADGSHDTDFAIAWSNGAAFARSALGLRGRPPWTIEWKGHHRPASKAIETIPADLRVDHVYLISCKYGSRILHNSGPVPLFDHRLAPDGPIARQNWFEVVAPDTFRRVWEPVHRTVGLPVDITPSTTTTAQREAIKQHLDGHRFDTTSVEYAAFVAEASARTATRWQANVRGKAQRSELVWRLLRMEAAPYFVLGARHDDTALAYRVASPWDFTQHFQVAGFEVAAGERGQPSVDWMVHIVDRDGTDRGVRGHVEVRWSHGKLAGPPEAKVYLDTDPLDVPGYDALEPRPPDATRVGAVRIAERPPLDGRLTLFGSDDVVDAQL